MASDPDFSVHWNPKNLRHRLILFYTAELQKIQKDLWALDAEDYKDNPYILESHSAEHQYRIERAGAKAQRLRLIKEATATMHERGRARLDLLQCMKLTNADDLLIREHTIQSFGPPSKDSLQSVLQFLHDYRPLDPSEEDPWLNPLEVVSLAAGKASTWLERATTRCLRKLGGSLAQVSRCDCWLQ